MNRHYISKVLQEFDAHIEVIESLLRLLKNEQLTEQFLLRQMDELDRNINALVLLIDEVKLERKQFLKRMQDISFTFNETDDYIYYEILTNNVNTKEIAERLGKTEKYVRDRVYVIRKEIDTNCKVDGSLIEQLGELVKWKCKSNVGA